MLFAESKQLKNSGRKVNSAGFCLFIQLLRIPYVTCLSRHQISRRVSCSESRQMCHGHVHVEIFLAFVNTKRQMRNG